MFSGGTGLGLRQEFCEFGQGFFESLGLRNNAFEQISRLGEAVCRVSERKLAWLEIRSDFIPG
jgi:hypothetical protein